MNTRRTVSSCRKMTLAKILKLLILHRLAAQAFQQFQVLLQRFIENEPFEQGTRVKVYAHGRSSLSKLLQVPNFLDNGGFNLDISPFCKDGQEEGRWLFSGSSPSKLTSASSSLTRKGEKKAIVYPRELRVETVYFEGSSLDDLEGCSGVFVTSIINGFKATREREEYHAYALSGLSHLE
ncbi:hypothetical protein Cni_G15063 [Canna indica]|uniref:Uncharacterized protein n=1 Tax=Canna indica TaxID=4628 RepID=A0AAQ3QEF0_9LILI|nr:hypothetical protein Cni_G15063 [Canna indica]